MNEQPQEARDEEDLLEQIITQGLEKMKAPSQIIAVDDAPAEEMPAAPQRKDSGEAAPPASRKNRRSAVYLYLLILFGAAFLMLLLAYFVQQRSSESTISDLRDSMNLSREELLEQIIALEVQNAALQELYESQRREISERIDAYDALVVELYPAQAELYLWRLFWELEQFYQAGDYDGCAAILILQLENEYAHRTPNGTEQRYEEIIQAVIDAGILAEDYNLHPDDYGELLDAYFSTIYIVESAQWAG